MTDGRNAPLGAGDVVAGFEIEELIGSGFSGTVFRAHKVDDPLVLAVVKAHFGTSCCATDEEFASELAINAEQPIRGEMPGFLGSGKLKDGTAFFVSEYLKMMPVDTETGNPKPMSARNLNVFMNRFCRIVGRLHAKYVHCDIKPDNIALEDRRPKLIDFGCSVPVKDIGPRLVRCGSWEYMAPEIRDGRWVDHRADVYSLGVLLKKLTRGRVRRVHDALIVKATSANPEERPASVVAFLAQFNTDQDRLAKFVTIATAAFASAAIVGLVYAAIAYFDYRRSYNEHVRSVQTSASAESLVKMGLRLYEHAQFEQAYNYLSRGTAAPDYDPGLFAEIADVEDLKRDCARRIMGRSRTNSSLSNWQCR